MRQIQLFFLDRPEWEFEPFLSWNFGQKWSFTEILRSLAQLKVKIG
jgi:hypothetical protein